MWGTEDLKEGAAYVACCTLLCCVLYAPVLYAPLCVASLPSSCAVRAVMVGLSRVWGPLCTAGFPALHNRLWFADHFLPPSPGSPGGQRDQEQGTAFEGFTLASVAAGMTKKLEIGHLVLGNTYRNPALVAKMASTLDQASKGRFILSLGAAWFAREHEAYGWVFPSMRERSDRFEEACELIRLLFTSKEPVNYSGTYYSLEEAPLSPPCYRNPHVPILVGGTGEKRTLRTLAKQIGRRRVGKECRSRWSPYH